MKEIKPSSKRQWVGAYISPPCIDKQTLNGDQLLVVALVGEFWPWLSVVTLILSTSAIWFWTVRRRTDKAKIPVHS